MATEAQRRGILYSAGVLAGAVLIFLGFGVTFAPELGTRLSGAALLAGSEAYDEALKEVDLGIREHPEELDGYIFRAAILAQARRYDDALAAYDAALGHDHATGDIRLELLQDRASILLTLGRMEEFDAACADLDANGGARHVHTLRGLAACQKRDYPDAARHFEAALAIDDTDQIRGRVWDVLLTWGRDLVAEGRLPEARRCFQRAGELIPANAIAFLKGAEVRLAENDADGALAVMAGCKADTPGAAPLFVRIATAYLARGDSDQALSCLSDAITCDREATEVLVKQEPAWDFLHDDAKWNAFVEKAANASRPIAGQDDGKISGADQAVRGE